MLWRAGLFVCLVVAWLGESVGLEVADVLHQDELRADTCEHKVSGSEQSHITIKHTLMHTQ